MRVALDGVFSQDVVEAISLYYGLKFDFPYACERYGLGRSLPLHLQNTIRDWARPPPQYYVPDLLWLRSFPRIDSSALEEFGLWVRAGMPVDTAEPRLDVTVLDRRRPWRIDSL